MNQSQRPGQITFYDELGVAPDATAEEIRDAFRALARLLHPDQQTDPLLKAMAERQMRRLNPIYATLSDPEKRQRYDDDLEDGFPPAIVIGHAPVRNLRRLAGRGVWLAAILVSAGALVWLAADNPVTPAFIDRNEARAPVETASGAISTAGVTGTSAAGSDVFRLRAELRAVAAQRDAALNELAKSRAPSESPVEEGALPVKSQQTHTSPPSAALTEPVPAGPVARSVTGSPVSRSTEITAAKRLSGFWFYVKPKDGQNNRNKSLYVPEYIEASLTDENGTVQGRYRSRFQIIDRAISPDVSFTFNGVPGSASMTAPWTGPGGARGEVTLKLMPDNMLQVDWTTSQLGSQQGLVSGTAVLTKRID